DEARALLDELGFVRRWRVLGPFDNEGKRGFETVLPPERALDAETDLSAEYPGAERPVRFRTIPDIGAALVVSLGPFFSPPTNVCGFAETFVRIDRARPLAVLAGASGAFRVYWNGARVLEESLYRTVDVDRSAALVEGRAGWNRILVKVCGADPGEA